jgi:hypothetical protein
VLVEQHEVLKIPISGMPAAIVDSSWIDMLAGLAKPGICKMPPDFCANEVSVASKAASSVLAITYNRTTLLIIALPPSPMRPLSRSQLFRFCRFAADAEVITYPIEAPTRKDCWPAREAERDQDQVFEIPRFWVRKAGVSRTASGRSATISGISGVRLAWPWACQRSIRSSYVLVKKSPTVFDP